MAAGEILEGRTAEATDRHLEEMGRGGAADRRNGACRRWLLTELGQIEPCLPRTRRLDPIRSIRC